MTMMPKSKQTLPDLMIITGVMMVTCAIPVGIVLALQSYYMFHLDLHWAIIQALVMMISTAITGGILFCLGEYIIKKRRKTAETIKSLDEK